ncbi:MLP-like protein 43 [Arachis stenosperma]|uniref:MLP-like protein 43 n=1 Tax=Arachis stenosperma TaxID=217475 RepID=UPI0025AD71FB|nr:MLP-like protein 43 [Arachis stenosperma]
MSLSGKVESEIEIEANASEFYKVFRKQLYDIPKISSDKVHGAQVHQGDWENLGSVKHWDYTIEGKKTSAKEKIEAIDDENKTITYSLFGEKISNDYKTLKGTIKVSDKVSGGGIVKWIFEYEKHKENITAASPQSYLDFAIKVTQDIDAHLINP